MDIGNCKCLIASKEYESDRKIINYKNYVKLREKKEEIINQRYINKEDGGKEIIIKNSLSITDHEHMDKEKEKEREKEKAEILFIRRINKNISLTKENENKNENENENKKEIQNQIELNENSDTFHIINHSDDENSINKEMKEYK